MSIQRQIIQIHAQAPLKPPEGAPCTGCGVCCLSEPCPLGVALSGRRRGACEALKWCEAGRVYRCGAISEPETVLRQALPAWIRPLAKRLSPVLALLAKRWIAAGQGCDSTLEVTSPSGLIQQAGNSSTISPAHAELPAGHHPLPAHHHDKPNSTFEEF